jgi:hypothetical protein
MSCSSSSLKMEAIYSSETLVPTYKSTLLTTQETYIDNHSKNFTRYFTFIGVFEIIRGSLVGFE